ncbi:MAG: succinate dehydrogenase cytochrome b subunit [Acidobacteriota bacterium]
MSWILNFYRSAIGKKVVMAGTGIVLFGWITLHMLGNMKLYLGAEAINHYGAWLRVLGSPAFPNSFVLWVTRFLLVIAVWLHIQAATQLTIMNRAARPIEYGRKQDVAATYAARTMRWSGVIIALFVIYHLLHITTGTLHRNFVEGDPYHNVVVAFQQWWVSLIYIVANILLGFHLYHGLWSMFQSLGLNNPTFNPWRRSFATAFAVLITLGNISFPIAVLIGAVHL